MKDQLESIIDELREMDVGGVVRVYVDHAIEDLESALAECGE